jgi:ribonuclease BN (tRNA processing enzyme)
MRLTVVGSGDAFGAGGRLQTCFHLDLGGRAVLIDCGATVLIGMERCGLDPNKVDTILVSHLHGDHFGGLVWWLIHALYIGKRTSRLTVAGPVGTADRFLAAAEVLYPGVCSVARGFELSFVELASGQTTALDGLEVRSYQASHPSGAPAHMLRIAASGRVIAFSGDTEWIEDLIPCQAGADLFICECSTYKTKVPYHLCWSDIEANLPRFTAKRILVTHMSQAMLDNAPELLGPPLLAASDGLVLEL